MFAEKTFSKIIEVCFYVLFFLTPLVLTPYNFELFEFNKMLATYFLTIIITGSWIIKIILKGRVEIKKSPLDVFLLLFFLSSLLSTIFSIDPHTSLEGYYSRFHGGFLSTISYILLYYAFISNLDKQKALKTLYILLSSAFLITFYAVLEKFGIDAKYWVQDVQNRVFSTLGQPNWLGAFINSLIFIPLALGLKTKKKEKVKKTIFFGLSFIMFLALIFTNSKSAILAFWLSFFVFSFFLVYLNKKLLKTLGIIFFLSIFIYLGLGQKTYQYIKKTPLWLGIFTQKQLISPPPQPAQEKYIPYISESSDIRKVVWKGALKIFANYPFLGSGIETFAYSYYQFKPIEHNLLSEWDFLYNKAHNEFLNILANQGLLGILTYLGLITAFLVSTIKTFFKKKTKSKLLLTAFLSSYTSILITNFFGFSVVMIGLFFFLFPGFAFLLTNSLKKTYTINILSLSKKENAEKQIKNDKNLFIKDFLIVLTIIISLMFLNKVITKWRADFHFARGKNYSEAGYLQLGFEDLKKAIDLSSLEPVYHSTLAETASKIALAYTQADAASSAEIIDRFKNLSIQESNLALKLNPVNLSLYRSQAKVYIYLSYLDPSYTKDAIATLERAGNLAPHDAKTYYNLALLYQETEDINKAITTLEKTVELKPNYLKAWLDLTELYLKQEKKQKAKDALLFVLQKIDKGNKQAQKMLEEIE
jgi:putative inorganic carbon (hco3(-)) transporter